MKKLTFKEFVIQEKDGYIPLLIGTVTVNKIITYDLLANPSFDNAKFSINDYRKEIYEKRKRIIKKLFL